MVSVKSFRWLAFGLPSMLVGCALIAFPGSGDPQDTPGNTRTIALEPNHAVLYLVADGEAKGLYPSTIRFSVNAHGEGEASLQAEGLHWESSAPGVAAVDAEGNVRAIATGSAVVTVRTPGEAVSVATASVLVKDGGRVDVLIE